MKILEKHLGYYFSLVAILFFGFLTVIFLQDKSSQLLVLILTALFYILWGIIHHHLHHDLTAKIVVEYVLMGALGISAVFLLLKGGFGL